VPPPSGTTEVLIDPLPANGFSPGHSLLDHTTSREEAPTSPRSTPNPPRPRPMSELEAPTRTSPAQNTSDQGPRKHRFEGFAKDGCTTCKRRARLCDVARPVCGKCKEDGRSCHWPQPTAPQQPGSDDDGVNDQTHGELGEPRTPNLGPLRDELTCGTNPDLSPAFAYDATRRPSQRVVILGHSVDIVRRLAKD
jgi:hypothetical protein